MKLSRYLPICLFMSGLCAPVISADTLDKLADPEALRQKLPWLAEQDHWTDFATAEEIALYDGPETEWKMVPVGDYDLTGFNTKMLGSAVPPPGVHPRVLFSPEDLPGIRKRFIGSKNYLTAKHLLERNLWNPEGRDYQWYVRLLEGRLDELKFPPVGPEGHFNHSFANFPSSFYIVHTPFIPRILATAAAYALFTNDEARSRELAIVIANYYRLREPLVDFRNERGTDEYIERYKRGEEKMVPWPNDLWRGMHLTAGEENIGLAYDYTANWMTDEDKAFMQRYLKKATFGKRAYGQNSPVRWRDTNWVGWDLALVVTALALEGTPGFDPDMLRVAEETVEGYMTFGISPKGTIFETNGKNGAGFKYAVLTSVALARRGYRNFFGHPHFRNLHQSQAHQIAPFGGWNVDNGTFGNAPFASQWVAAAYPDEPLNVWMLQEGATPEPAESLEDYAFRLRATPAELREKGLPPVGRIRVDVMLDEWVPVPEFQLPEGKEAWERDHLGLGLDFEDPVHGQLTARSGNDKDALFMMVEARPDLYSVGHQHHDAGHFYLAADGLKWGIETHEIGRDSNYHSVVLIDGIGQGRDNHMAPARVDWLGASLAKNATFASADLTHGYNYVWTTPMHYSWAREERKELEWKPETEPDVVEIFRGTQNYKGRLWMHSYWNWNWGPTMRAEYNPVEYAYRSAGIVRGLPSDSPEKGRGYALVVDDIRKDDQTRLYQWQLQLPNDRIMVNMGRDAHPQQIVLAERANFHDPDRKLGLKAGDPCLIVRVLEATTDADPAGGMFQFQLETLPETQTGQRLIVNSRSVEPKFKVLLIPHRWGQPMPTATYSDGEAVLEWKDREGALLASDRIRFETGADHRTRFTVHRGGELLVEVK